MNEHEAAGASAVDPDGIRMEIEATRARIAETTEALAYKTDLPARVRESVDARLGVAKSATVEAAANAGAALGIAASNVARTAQTVASTTRERRSDVRPLTIFFGLVAVGLAVGYFSTSGRRGRSS